MQQNDPKLERIKEIVNQQVSRIDFQVRKIVPTGLCEYINGVVVISSNHQVYCLLHCWCQLKVLKCYLKMEG